MCEHDGTPPEVRLIPEERTTTSGVVREGVRADAAEDRAPRDALEVVRADRLERAVTLLESVRHLCLLLLAVIIIVATVDQFNEARQVKATRRVEEQFSEFNVKNEAFLFNHAKTQRILCEVIRSNDMPVPEDCSDR
jgi:hypothetical protein